MSNFRVFLCACFLLLPSLTLAQPASAPPEGDHHCTPLARPAYYYARVTAVPDGDAITALTFDNEQIKIKLYGIAAPQDTQPFGDQAKQIASAVALGREVIVLPRDTNRHGWTVALIILGADTLNAQLVRAGMAWVHPQDCTEDFCTEWRELERQAKEQGLGLWAGNEPVAPWEWKGK
jgi:endonuclease YncB( thermonuclease family)